MHSHVTHYLCFCFCYNLPLTAASAGLQTTARGSTRSVQPCGPDPVDRTLEKIKLNKTHTIATPFLHQRPGCPLVLQAALSWAQMKRTAIISMTSPKQIIAYWTIKLTRVDECHLKEDLVQRQWLMLQKKVAEKVTSERHCLQSHYQDPKKTKLAKENRPKQNHYGVLIRTLRNFTQYGPNCGGAPAGHGRGRR